MGIRDWEEESFGNPRDPRIRKIRKYVKGHTGADKDIEEQWRSHDDKCMTQDRMICKLMEFSGKRYYVDLGYYLPKDQHEDIASMPGVFKKKEDNKIVFYIKEKDLDRRIKENYKGLAKLLFRLSSPD